MKQEFKVGDLVRVAKGNDNQTYDKFRKKILKVTYVDKEFDKDGILYSFEDLQGNEIGNSLYDWELELVKRSKK